nr:putative polyprotein [Tanacetum cinerariifolium]
MSVEEIKQVVAQRVANAIEAIAIYKAKTNIALKSMSQTKRQKEKRRWLELLKDYDTNIQYHPGNANVVADALSRKSGMIAGLKYGYWAGLRIEPDLIPRIKEAQKEDSEIWTIVENLNKQSGMKGDVATFVARCLICQKVKIEHQRASGLLQQLDIPVWKWDEISMDFVTGLPQTQRRHDAIWVVVDRLTKSAHFLPIRKDYSVSRKVYRRLGESGLSSVLPFIPRQTVRPGDHVFLKVSPARGVRCFGIKGKLSPRFIGPFEILDRVGEVSYCLALLPQLSHIHNVFHVSLLRGYKYHPLHVITYPLDQIR